MRIVGLVMCLYISLGLNVPSYAGEFTKPASGAVPNQYIVVLAAAAPGYHHLGAAPGERATAFRSMAADLRRERSLGRWNLLDRLGILIVEAEATTAREIARDDRVLLVEQDAVGSVSVYQQCYEQPEYQQPLANSYDPTSPQAIQCWNPQTNCSDNWGLDRSDQRTGDVLAHTTDFSYHFSATGSGVHIYIADTGIAWNHEEFELSGGGSRIGNGASLVPGEWDAYDSLGHGTHVAGIAGGRRFGVAKDAILHPVKVCDDFGACQQSWVISGLDWIAANANRPAIVNMSFNLPRWRDDYSALEQAVSRFISWYDIGIVNSAGNWNQDARKFVPTRVPEVIVAGGITWVRNERWGSDYFYGCKENGCGSNYGSLVDLFAPAADVRSASTSPERACRLTGTSMAAPHVTGVAALYLQNNPNATPAEVESMLISNATVGVIPPDNLGPFTANRLLFTDF